MYQIDFNNPVHVFFSGIGGISMSGLARILQSRGFNVSGSARESSAITRGLTENGIPVMIGQKKENITYYERYRPRRLHGRDPSR